MSDKRGVLIEVNARNRKIQRIENTTWNTSSLGRSKNKNYLAEL
jgi:hypothetical protein